MREFVAQSSERVACDLPASEWQILAAEIELEISQQQVARARARALAKGAEPASEWIHGKQWERIVRRALTLLPSAQTQSVDPMGQRRKRPRKLRRRLRRVDAICAQSVCFARSFDRPSEQHRTQIASAARAHKLSCASLVVSLASSACA